MNGNTEELQRPLIKTMASKGGRMCEAVAFTTENNCLDCWRTVVASFQVDTSRAPETVI